MKKVLYLVVLISLFFITGCVNEKVVDDSPKDEMVSYKVLLLEVLDNKREFISEDNAATKIDDYLEYFYGSEVNKIIRYALLDIDSDMEDELVAQVEYEGIDYMYLVLNIDNKDIYGFGFVSRAMIGLRENGLYMSSGGASYNVLNSISFDKNNKVEKSLASQEDNKYQINNNESTSDDYQKYIKENYFDIEEVEFSEYRTIKN